MKNFKMYSMSIVMVVLVSLFIGCSSGGSGGSLPVSDLTDNPYVTEINNSVSEIKGIFGEEITFADEIFINRSYSFEYNLEQIASIDVVDPAIGKFLVVPEKNGNFIVTAKVYNESNDLYFTFNFTVIVEEATITDDDDDISLDDITNTIVDMENLREPVVSDDSIYLIDDYQVKIFNLSSLNEEVVIDVGMFIYHAISLKNGSVFLIGYTSDSKSKTMVINSDGSEISRIYNEIYFRAAISSGNVFILSGTDDAIIKFDFDGANLDVETDRYELEKVYGSEDIFTYGDKLVYVSSYDKLYRFNTSDGIELTGVIDNIATRNILIEGEKLYYLAGNGYFNVYNNIELVDSYRIDKMYTTSSTRTMQISRYKDYLVACSTNGVYLIDTVKKTVVAKKILPGIRGFSMSEDEIILRRKTGDDSILKITL